MTTMRKVSGFFKRTGSTISSPDGQNQKQQQQVETEEQRQRKERQKLMDDDPDLTQEASRLRALRVSGVEQTPETDVGKPAAGGCPFSGASRGECPYKHVPLRMNGRTYTKSSPSAQLLVDIGGPEAVFRMVEAHYEKVFQDRHIAPFFRDVSDPHAQRLSDWIVEKMGGGEPWSQERAVRPQTQVEVAGGHFMVVHDRSSAHQAAWHSIKRSRAKAGQHFKVDDCRVWMRLMFLSGREQGPMHNPGFAVWFTRFIAHFMRVYEQEAPQFARESARWSEGEDGAANVADYLAGNNRTMRDVVGLSTHDAKAQLPTDERAERTDWPYELDDGTV